MKEDCSQCHTALPNPLRPEGAIVKMSACTACHEHKTEVDQGTCENCHADLTRYPLKPLSLMSHKGNFVREHAAAARSTSSTCAQCHEQNFCTDCHNVSAAAPVEIKKPERVDARYIHRNDFVSRHSIEARADGAMCSRCHGVSYCQSCHTAKNLTPWGSNPRNPHPPGWANAGNASGHGKAARNDIESCASCHDQGATSICIDCHRSGGVGGDPHPRGWATKHPSSEIASNPMCGACH